MEEVSKLLVPILAGVLGSYLTYFFTLKSKRQEAIVKFKEEKYKSLLIKIQGFVGNTANAKTKKEFFEEQYQSWLYCSDEVVLAINELIELVKSNYGSEPDQDAGQKAIGNIVVAMRKDLLGKTSLNYKSFTYTDVHE
ncbi:MAG: hypothetical protein ACJA2Y_001427 [Cycloclasticus pugetii]|jgi:hypothetical protein|uniref:hypothetical protein n=1 Tax=Cycloclasticus pugetii TaxID=34068 RepID=UPI0039E394F4